MHLRTGSTNEAAFSVDREVVRSFAVACVFVGVGWHPQPSFCWVFQILSRQASGRTLREIERRASCTRPSGTRMERIAMFQAGVRTQPHFQISAQALAEIALAHKRGMDGEVFLSGFLGDTWKQCFDAPSALAAFVTDVPCVVRRSCRRGSCLAGGSQRQDTLRVYTGLRQVCSIHSRTDGVVKRVARRAPPRHDPLFGQTS